MCHFFFEDFEKHPTFGQLIIFAPFVLLFQFIPQILYYKHIIESNETYHFRQRLLNDT